MRGRAEQDPELMERALRWSMGTHTHRSADETSLCMSVCILLGMMGLGTLLGPPTESRTPGGTWRGFYRKQPHLRRNKAWEVVGRSPRV